jgi:hypothetical protein
MTLTTVRTYKANGPYFPPTVMKYQAASTKDILFHCRLAMDDGEDLIGVFHGDVCKGIWENDTEPEPDGEGGWEWPSASYVLKREPGRSPKHFATILELLK